MVENVTDSIRLSWNVQKKVDSVRFTNANPTLYYTYDAQGNRLSKRTNPDFANYYVRDAQGNALATYALKKDSLYLIEQNLYGSSRLGLKNLAILAQIDTQRQQISDTLRIFEEHVGAKNYELSNHLGNVLATISDKTIFNTDHYNSIVYSAQLYYPFGWEIPTLSYTAKKYRFGFNGKEDDREWHAQDYGFRLYTPRESRFISVDPITAEYPELTPYQFASNSPIAGIDLDGLEFTAATVNQFTKAMWGVKLIPIDEFDLAEIIVETSVSTAKTAGTFSSFVASGFANAWVYGFKGTKEAKPFDFYDFTDGSWKGWDTNEGRASHDRMLADGVTELGSAAVGSMGGKVVKGISKRLLRGRGGAGQGFLNFDAANTQAFRGISFYPDGSRIGTNNCIYCAIKTAIVR